MRTVSMLIIDAMVKGCSILYSLEKKKFSCSHSQVIDSEPVESERFHHIHERAEFDRFNYVAVCTETVGRLNIRILGRGSDHDNWNRMCTWIGAYGFQHLKTVDFGKFEVEKHH